MREEKKHGREQEEMNSKCMLTGGLIATILGNLELS